MNHHSKLSFNRLAILCAPFAVAIFTSAPILAQQKAIVTELNATEAAATKALSVISKPGSYQLARGIVNNHAGYDSILVTASDVTIDLLGLTIMCTAATTGAGIDATGQSNVVIHNGIITGCGGPAIIAGNNANISGITASENGRAGGGIGGFSCGIGCLVSNNTLQSNMGIGMSFSDATSGYLGNVLQGNDGNTVGTTGQVSGGTSLGQNLCNGVVC